MAAVYGRPTDPQEVGGEKRSQSGSPMAVFFIAITSLVSSSCVLVGS